MATDDEKRAWRRRMGHPFEGGDSGPQTREIICQHCGGWATVVRGERKYRTCQYCGQNPFTGVGK